MNSSYQVFFRPYHSNRFKGWYRFLVTKYVGRNRETLYYGVAESFSQALERVNTYFRGETLHMIKIGFLKSFDRIPRVICINCISNQYGIDESTNPIYESNILPYWQTCYNCHSLLVIGKTPAWPELF